MGRNKAYFSVELDTPLGPIRGKVEVDSGPMYLAELVPTAFELTQILVERARHHLEKQGKRISCRAGCAACRSQMVPLSAPETFYLADLIGSFTAAQQAHLQKRFDAIVDRLKALQMIDQLLDPEYADEQALPIAKEYFKLRMPCPFLVDKSCSIHPNRPIACREYNVTSPAEWCADPYSHDIAKVPMPLPLSAPLARLTTGLTRTKPQLIPLVLAPLWVSKHMEWKRHPWPGVGLFQKFMELIGPPPSAE